MKYVIIVDTNKYKYHKMLCENITECLKKASGELFEDGLIEDVGKDTRLAHEIFFEIRDYGPNLIVNLDLTGFVFKTENDNISLNSLPCRIVNVLLHKSDYYGKDMRYRQNLSMFTYFSNNEYLGKGIEGITARYYEEIPNPKRMCEYDYNASTEDALCANSANIMRWITDMIQEVRL